MYNLYHNHLVDTSQIVYYIHGIMEQKKVYGNEEKYKEKAYTMVTILRMEGKKKNI